MQRCRKITDDQSVHTHRHGQTKGENPQQSRVNNFMPPWHLTIFNEIENQMIHVEVKHTRTPLDVYFE